MAAATTRSGRKLPSIRTLWAIAKSPELGLTDEDLHGAVSYTHLTLPTTERV